MPMCYNALALSIFYKFKENTQLDITQSDNRRVFKRFSLKEPIHIRFADANMASGCLGFDVSEGGVKFMYNDFIPLNQRLNLEITLKNQEVVQCTGQVVWVQKMPHTHRYQAGVRFNDDSLIYDARSRIHSYFDKNG